MAEYIDKQAFLDYMKGTNRYFTVKCDIEEFPAAEVVARGRWIESHDYLRCPKCGAMVKRDFVFFDIGDWNFCPNCGAKMDEGELAELTKNVFGEDYKERERKSTIAEYKNKKEN